VKSILKLFAKHAISKMRYPGFKLGFGSNIDRKTEINGSLAVDRYTEVTESKIAGHVTIGQGCWIFKSELYGNVRISRRCQITRTSIGRFTYLTEDCRVNFCRIGNFCSIGPGLMCGLGKHPTDWISTSPVFYSAESPVRTFSKHTCFQEYEQTDIGSDVHIGARVILRDGIKIGNGVIIGAGAVVVHDIPDFAIVAGVPAKFIRFRFGEAHRQELLLINWWNWPEDKIKTYQKLFRQKDIEEFIEAARNNQQYH
jgi:acetyltransferase-like isoleucine patch superfamily enzyme